MINFKKDSSITNKWGELFLPLYLAAVEPHLLGFVRTKGEVDGFALITNLALGVLQSQVDGDDVAALTGDVTTHRNLLVLKLKKQHPCGSREWEVLRVGADFRLKCLGCGHQIMIARKLLEKNVKEIVEKA